MKVRAGAWYITQRGRIVGPLQLMSHMLTESYEFKHYDEPGIWNRFGKCNHPETKTGWTYGNLLSETAEPKQEGIMPCV